jgi:hypothetical protein
VAHSTLGEVAVRVPFMKKFEYFTAPLLVHSTKEILDNFGQDGWELVQVVQGPNPESLVAYLKREIEES